MNRQSHWEQVYTTRDPRAVSWYQPVPALSLRFIANACRNRPGRVLDAGGGTSSLVDHLLDAGYPAPTVVDISAHALELSRARLGDRAAGVHWIAGDVTSVPLDRDSIDAWHDRAVFHFLTEREDRARYVEQVRRALAPGGAIVIATFAEDGPVRCSGLETCRYSAEALAAEFGDAFTLEESDRELHRTPSGAEQWFTWCLLRNDRPAPTPRVARAPG